MHLLWRHILRGYFQILCLCVASFIAVLLAARFQEIARFASSGASLRLVLLFVLYQIPYILPIAIPISCGICTFLLLQQMSHSQELTALRSCGLSIHSLLSPILTAGACMALCNVTIICELAPFCRLQTKLLTYEIAAKNPFFLFQKETLIRLKNPYVDMRVRHSGESAEDVLVVMKSSWQERLSLMLAKKLHLKEQWLDGEFVTLVSSVAPKEGESFDHLVIENQRAMRTQATTFAQQVQSTEWFGNEQYLPLRLLLAKEVVERGGLANMSSSVQIELSRRMTLGLAAFSFTLLGAACGIQISRSPSKRGLLFALLFTTLFLVCFVSAKSLRHTPHLCPIVYLLAHPPIALFSLYRLKRVSGGIE